MKHSSELGSRIASVHNGSALFTGDAGQGESEIRKWLIEKDFLEAIVALPERIFYNTGIATYIFILTNRKPPHKTGKVQLIDATEMYSDMRDTENVPLKEDIQAYFKREVQPYVPDAWIDHSKTKTGYEINFNRYFYQYEPLRDLQDIKTDIKQLEKETEGLLGEILDG